MNKYTRKLPKDELKRLAKEISKKLVASDYKNKRVNDPTTISSERAKGVKRHVKEFLDKAVVKFKEHEKRKAETKQGSADSKAVDAISKAEPATPQVDEVDEEVVLTDNEDTATPTSSSSDRKRKRPDEEADSAEQTPSETPSVKRIKDDDVDIPSPPPPPPPPPEAAADAAPDTPMTEEERYMKEQEEALVRENEEAERLEEEAERTKHLEEEAALERENEEAMRDFELTHNPLVANGVEAKGGDGIPMDINGDLMAVSDAMEVDEGLLGHNEAPEEEAVNP